MATDQTIIADTPSDEVRILREQVNRLTIFVEAVKAAALTDGDTFMTNVAALTEDTAFVNIVVSPSPPVPRRFPTT